MGARARAQVVAGRWASGRAAGGRCAGARQQHAGRAGGARRAGNGRQARGQARRGRAGACGWAHDALKSRPAWALDGCAGWASWASFGALCTWLSSGSVFGPGSTRYFPESPNEHCSL